MTNSEFSKQEKYVSAKIYRTCFIVYFQNFVNHCTWKCSKTGLFKIEMKFYSPSSEISFAFLSKFTTF